MVNCSHTKLYLPPFAWPLVSSNYQILPNTHTTLQSFVHFGSTPRQTKFRKPPKPDMKPQSRNPKPLSRQPPNPSLPVSAPPSPAPMKRRCDGCVVPRVTGFRAPCLKRLRVQGFSLCAECRVSFRPLLPFAVGQCESYRCERKR